LIHVCAMEVLFCQPWRELVLHTTLLAAWTDTSKAQI
jgi:hypothetical protein